MENRIKEQMCLFADRLSTDGMKGNQLRLYFSALAYTLMEALRRQGQAVQNGLRPKSIPPASRCSRSEPWSGSACAASCSDELSLRLETHLRSSLPRPALLTTAIDPAHRTTNFAELFSRGALHKNHPYPPNQTPLRAADIGTYPPRDKKSSP
jgi:hypothetical protein